jgi:hypoxanthine phosphoribosyltransferase
MQGDLQKILVDEAAIQKRIKELGAAISERYAESEELTVIAIINGAILFVADLIRAIDVPVRLDCIRVSSYGNSTEPEGAAKILDTVRLDLQGRDVLLIDDIYDTGRTLERVTNLMADEKPASLSVCVMLEKSSRHDIALKPDFVGFQIPDQFVVGYGLDFAERYRNLPCIGVLKPELQNPPEWR